MLFILLVVIVSFCFFCFFFGSDTHDENSFEETRQATTDLR